MNRGQPPGTPTNLYPLETVDYCDPQPAARTWPIKNRLSSLKAVFIGHCHFYTGGIKNQTENESGMTHISAHLEAKKMEEQHHKTPQVHVKVLLELLWLLLDLWGLGT